MADVLRIATFNLENLDTGPQAELPVERRLSVLRPQLEALSADILCLQEVNAQKTQGQSGRRLEALDRLLEGTAYAGFERAHSTATANGRLSDHHNLVTLSRWPIRSSRQIRHDYVDPPIYRPATAKPRGKEAETLEWDRPLLLTEIDLPSGAALHVINLHLRAPLAAPVKGQKHAPDRWKSVGGWAEGFFIASMKRGGQALEARLALEEIFDRAPRALIAVLGDFNAEGRETPLVALKGQIEENEDPGLAARSLVALDEAVPANRRYSVLHGGQEVMLDHLLVSRVLADLARRVDVDNRDLRDELADERAETATAMSHHAPVVAEFDMPGREP
ncbi:MAG: endonuclease/exonuclease/phosphatase family protein [Rhodovibrionaceae bacterium]|nr:endonuclease/exonuclease/phosphatase family protein [Rhodovibrionaceae bacterium]